MRCVRCGSHNASVHMTIKVGAAYLEMNFCPSCSPAPNAQVEIPINMIRCQRCGSSAVDVERRGFGCADDYEIFAQAVAKGLEQYHHASQHVGKSPNSRKLFA